MSIKYFSQIRSNERFRYKDFSGHYLKTVKEKAVFYLEIALASGESSEEAKLAAKKALRIHSNPGTFVRLYNIKLIGDLTKFDHSNLVACNICGEFMKNEKGRTNFFLIQEGFLKLKCKLMLMLAKYFKNFLSGPRSYDRSEFFTLVRSKLKMYCIPSDDFFYE
ncbi:hypothetical protein BpHYR1_047824 [Brachionus plicatilis]|uniref:Uncharacterized protein n=1 Tax=Brachionus plicatilis TaxID=10195 RepID=A0A3M7Q4E2_BRAPC|nr:hypothetical protein BpHYR1_047824 [Brachionus plicatilis]